MSVPVTGAGEVGRRLDVSRETMDRLEAYAGALRHWQKGVNLVGKATLEDLWGRHILDCGQLFRHLPDKCPSVMDLGSGAGLPGLVLAIMAAEKMPGMATILVESDGRKCAFLAEAARKAGVEVDIRNERAERLPAMAPAVITARALAPLERLLEWTRPQHHAGLECLFLKGASHAQELTSIANSPNIAAQVLPSETSPEGAIIRLTGFAVLKSP